MITIVIHYSCDRKPQLLNTIECLKDMSLYNSAEKILLVDGKSNIFPPDWKVIEVERDNPEFYNCSKIWNLGIKLASNELVLTLESDRILPKNWFSYVLPMVHTPEPFFIFNTELYSLNDNYDIDSIRSIRDNIDSHKDKLIEDFRVLNPNLGIGKKNPMSGCLLTTKTSFDLIGGFDERYIQAGYHDLDAFRKAYSIGAIFKVPKIRSIELHQKHEYAGGMERFKTVNLHNAIKYFDKWNLPVHENIYKLAESLNVAIT